MIKTAENRSILFTLFNILFELFSLKPLIGQQKRCEFQQAAAPGWVGKGWLLRPPAVERNKALCSLKRSGKAAM